MQDSDFEIEDLFRKDCITILNQHNVRLNYQATVSMMDPELKSHLTDIETSHQSYYDLYCLMHYRFRDETFFPETILRGENAEDVQRYFDGRSKKVPCAAG